MSEEKSNPADFEKVKLRMFLVEDREISFVVQRKREQVFIPRSLAATRLIRTQHDGRRTVEFTLPRWKVKQASLEDYEVD